MVSSSAPTFQYYDSNTGVWGYDEITWFSLQSEENRNAFLLYAFEWLQENDGEYGFVQMPGSRVITFADGGKGRYRANTSSTTCPQGLSQEKTIKEIWIKQEG